MQLSAVSVRCCIAADARLQSSYIQHGRNYCHCILCNAGDSQTRMGPNMVPRKYVAAHNRGLSYDCFYSLGNTAQHWFFRPVWGAYIYQSSQHISIATHADFSKGLQFIDMPLLHTRDPSASKALPEN